MHATHSRPRPVPAAGSDRLTKADLVGWLESGCKPPEAWRIGTEHESFGYRLSDRAPLPYDGPGGVRAVLEALTRFGWEPILEEGRPIALALGGAAITLEPGGQIELAGAPLATVHDSAAELRRHSEQLREVGRELGVGFLAIGFAPTWPREAMPWMPKARYAVMRRHMPTRGSLGLDMMVRTATVQANLDFASEADMVLKLRVGLALQPVATALLANSPLVEGRPSGYSSFRSHVWSDTDPDRCGALPFAFEPGMGFERWADYALGVPMYFAYRDGRYVDARGQSFRDFVDGRLPALPGVAATLDDWETHLGTLFPEVRLKRYLEMRGADSGELRNLCALPALWVALCYDAAALQGATDLIADWTPEERAAMSEEVPRTGLRTPFRGGTVRDLARTVLGLAAGGLARRARPGEDGSPDERRYLEPLEEAVETGLAPADRLLEAFATRWGGSVEPLFAAHTHPGSSAPVAP